MAAEIRNGDDRVDRAWVAALDRSPALSLGLTTATSWGFEEAPAPLPEEDSALRVRLGIALACLAMAVPGSCTISCTLPPAHGGDRGGCLLLGLPRPVSRAAPRNDRRVAPRATSGPRCNMDTRAGAPPWMGCDEHEIARLLSAHARPGDRQRARNHLTARPADRRCPWHHPPHSPGNPSLRAPRLTGDIPTKLRNHIGARQNASSCRLLATVLEARV